VYFLSKNFFCFKRKIKKKFFFFFDIFRWGEIVNLNLLRDKKTGKSKGFAFICYEDQRSTILAVDNFNGTTLAGRSIRVDHVKDYKPPKEHENDDDLIKTLKELGCAPGVELPAPSSSSSPSRRKDEKNSTYIKQESKRFKK
jgi:RNA-binding motif X-linked protein 2